MLLCTYSTLLLLLATEDAGSRGSVAIKARLREALSLDCTFNCSSGFIRGVWTWEDTPACASCVWENHHSMMYNDMCTVTLRTLNLTMEQTLYNYSCFSVMSDHQDLPRKMERLVSLRVEDKTTAPVSRHEVPVALKVQVYRNGENNSFEKSTVGPVRVAVGTQLQLRCLSNDKHCESQWMRDNGVLPNANTGTLLHWAEITEEDGGNYTCHAKQLCASQNITVIIEVIKYDYSGWIRLLAAIALSTVVMLMFKLIFLWYKKRSGLRKSEVSSRVTHENTRTKNEGAVLEHPAQDCQSDHEVPYADIVISVRGSSVPELTGVRSHDPRDHRLRWREDVTPGIRLHACRSADRLQVNPKEVTRKLSTTSEYAVITYSAEALS